MRKSKFDPTQYYRWQFLRLNPRYQTQFDSFQEALKLQKKAGNDTSSFIENETRDFVRIYGINGIFDYRQKEPKESLRIYGVADFPVEKGTLEDVFGKSLNKRQKIYGDYLTEKLDGCLYRKAFQVVINCDADWSDINDQLQSWYKSVRKERGKAAVSKPKTHITRKVELEGYLKAYALSKAGKSNVGIAKLVFPKYFKSNKRAAENKACDYRAAAEKYVNGDYRRIKFLS